MTRPRLWIDRLLSPGTAVLIAGLMAVVYTTLSPFAFQWHTLNLANAIERFQLAPSSLSDMPLNVLLFMPIGFGLASLAARIGLARRWLWLVALLGGLVGTLTVELLQVTLDVRTPSAADLAMNMLGAVAGSLTWLLWAAVMDRWSRPIKRTVNLLTPFWLVIPLLLVYGYGLMLLAERLAPTTSFATWNEQYPLLLGNEWVTPKWDERRPWEGSLSDVVVTDEALTSAEIATLFASDDPTSLLGSALQADYPLSDASELADRSGQQIDLVWEGSAESADDGVAVGADGWLIALPDAAPLTTALRDSNRFTIRLRAQTDDPTQVGPARLFTLSADIFHRNVSLSQEADALSIRMRTPLGGANGRDAELFVPQVFIDTEWQDMAVSFDGATITAVIDDRVVVSDLLPSVALFRLPYLEQQGWWSFSANGFTEWYFRLAAYGLLLIPFGLLLGTLPQTKARWLWLALTAISAVAVSLLIEFVFVRELGIDWRLVNLVVPTLIVLWSAWVMRRWLQPVAG